MKLEMEGIIIKEKDSSESDKIITILTSEKGVISVIAKHSKSLKNRLGGMAELFSYANFTLYEGKYGYLLNSMDVKETFSGLRHDLKSLSLAQYFCQLCLILRPEAAVSSEVLRLFLNCLYYLSKEKMDIFLLKSIFELKMCSLCGYMPELVSCSKCKSYESEVIGFAIEKGKIFCKTCASNRDFLILINSSILNSLRHIVYSPLKNLFKFSISNETVKNLNLITEKYVKIHVCERFKSLEFFNLLN